MIANQGMGDVNQTSTTIGGTLGTSLLTAGAIAGGPTNPVGIGLMVAGGVVMLGTSLLKVFGVGARNPIEDRDVKTLNELEVGLQQNLAAWNSGSRTSEEQTQRLAYVDAVMANLNTLCHDPGLGENWASGCIKDRQPGGKWDWFAMYRTPIARATASDAGSVSSLVDSGNMMYVGVGALLFGVMLATKD